MHFTEKSVFAQAQRNKTKQADDRKCPESRLVHEIDLIY